MARPSRRRHPGAVQGETIETVRDATIPTGIDQRFREARRLSSPASSARSGPGPSVFLGEMISADADIPCLNSAFVRLANGSSLRQS